jgi:hypothetical protein
VIVGTPFRFAKLRLKCSFAQLQEEIHASIFQRSEFIEFTAGLVPDAAN